jgi:hypothetical protein
MSSNNVVGRHGPGQSAVILAAIASATVSFTASAFLATQARARASDAIGGEVQVMLLAGESSGARMRHLQRANGG